MLHIKYGVGRQRGIEAPDLPSSVILWIWPRKCVASASIFTSDANNLALCNQGRLSAESFYVQYAHPTTQVIKDACLAPLMA
jgi:hypothetical protein